MAGNNESTFGFELLQKLTVNDISKKEDIIILLIHWYIIKYGSKCIGLGNSRTFDSSDRGSEALPNEWSRSPNYELRYLKDGKLFLLHAAKTNDSLLINLLRVEDNKVATIEFPISHTVNELHGPLEVLIPQYQLILPTIRNNFLEPVFSSGNVHVSMQTAARSENQHETRQIELGPDPLRIHQPPTQRDPLRAWDPAATSVGSADLDPFSLESPGVGGGGMLFDPFSRHSPLLYNNDPRRIGGLGVPEGLPPGSVPPGARFSPFGPPDDYVPPRRLNPDNDELPPPRYDDIM